MKIVSRGVINTCYLSVTLLMGIAAPRLAYPRTGVGPDLPSADSGSLLQAWLRFESGTCERPCSLSLPIPQSPLFCDNRKCTPRTSNHPQQIQVTRTCLQSTS